jgi:hypothetical protein
MSFSDEAYFEWWPLYLIVPTRDYKTSQRKNGRDSDKEKVKRTEGSGRRYTKPHRTQLYCGPTTGFLHLIVSI